MNTEQIKALAEQLDWRADPRPSPYQVEAKRILLSLPPQDTLPVLRQMEAEMRQTPGFCPYSYSYDVECRYNLPHSHA